ncbi:MULTISPECIES: peptide chain release factor N(5)-glutamine methyltransferase [Bacillota]|jgi:release factor glutamine methyltransferase|uniref:Release factor glutamine methyltransferase n=2 Tax=Amedibacillus TaxID=2749846 RepID=A0A7G9GPH6_9FIRM|nr:MULTISPECIES: peptide chain release factor N(5)-glutamine methyltransferase [Bacillota]QNM12708.1 peptide chain release factor N(5)-glutamine methyltransferase [[Eubacterium] hominis]MCH4287496.1 peptide chain release factor N(5)-glutamine methyltransferase [Amedibacillus hominis]RGB49088.1 peptide chain release factor N(5)-glutamine methyltransferase [Absiella sp. AM22-9]RGB54147.1 peptide chain release factor N(5)-glutamine methyltransferase [Absiella sp. AM10-20]RGB63068.1 peptide chain 
MASYREVLHKAKQEMEAAGRGEQAALFYMLELTNKEAHNLYMEFEEEMPLDIQSAYEAGIKRLVAGEPLGHVLGFEWFYGYRFKVNEDVLIPRPETEELVANVLAAYDEYFSNVENVMAVDIGTGSGAIAISLKKEEPNLHMMATDISEKAVLVAKDNAQENEAIVSFLVGDMLQPLIERDIKVDILISNPPYIPKEEVMEDSVVNYEPHVALFGGEDGLKFYRVIFENAPQVLKEKAMMAFEMGYNQKEALSALAKSYFPEAKIEVMKDMNGKNRMLFVYLNLA